MTRQLNTPLQKEPRQPEAVVACLAAQRHLRRLTRDLGHAVPRRVQLGHQSFGVTAPDGRPLPERSTAGRAGVGQGRTTCEAG